MMPAVRLGLTILVLLFSSTAWAVPGPDSVVVVANATITESVALAERYADARSIPDRQVCLLDLPRRSRMDLGVYETDFLAPFEACLDRAGATSRVESVVLVKGVPIQVAIPVGERNRTASLAAVLAAWKSTTISGRPLVGTEPGREVSCGGRPCYAARYPNPFTQGVFEPGWVRTTAGVTWRPLIVTALEGRTYDEAAQLVASATTAEANPPATGDFVFMNGNGGARSVLDGEYPELVEDLADLGFDAEVVPFDRNLEGRTFAAFFVGTATLSRTIEGNTYLPGSLVDNLTSLGAVPANFQPDDERQVSIARWVAKGVAGAHGAVTEPLNNVFPSRRLIVDYAAGGTLGEAYFRRMPYVYWRNLVLGDPMTAPYAVRPVVTVSGAAAGERVVGARWVTVEAVDPLSRGIATLKLFVDGELIDETAGDRLTTCVVAPEGPGVQLLAVAHVEDDFTPAGFHRPKGWTDLRIDAEAGATACEAPDAGAPDAADAATPDAAVDAGPRDAGAADAGGLDATAPDATADASSAPADDAGPTVSATPPDDNGCRCVTFTGPGPGPSGLALLALAITLAVGGRRRDARSRARRARRQSSTTAR